MLSYVDSTLEKESISNTLDVSLVLLNGDNVLPPLLCDVAAAAEWPLLCPEDSRDRFGSYRLSDLGRRMSEF